ncbi:MAG: STAS domain-containing protein [Acidobacteria bacterium]|nr:STAS domain-containing protein [Acidobacteriota bacterium]
METAIGVFSSRVRAEGAVRELLKAKVPEDAIVFLSRSESEARTVTQQFAATIGEIMGVATGASAGLVAASLNIPEIGPVFAFGFGAATLLGASARESAENKIAPTADEKAPEDVAFFRDVLKQGRSLIVVRTGSKDTAAVASTILNRFGLGMRGRVPGGLEISIRRTADLVIVDVAGRLTIGDACSCFRNQVQHLTEQGIKKLLLNLSEVVYVDSSGLGELVRTYTGLRAQGGEMKLVNPHRRLRELLELTRLSTIFDVQPDEATAIGSLDRVRRSRLTVRAFENGKSERRVNEDTSQ